MLTWVRLGVCRRITQHSLTNITHPGLTPICVVLVWRVGRRKKCTKGWIKQNYLSIPLNIFATCCRIASAILEVYGGDSDCGSGKEGVGSVSSRSRTADTVSRRHSLQRQPKSCSRIITIFLKLGSLLVRQQTFFSWSKFIRTVLAEMRHAPFIARTVLVKNGGVEEAMNILNK